MKKRVWVIIAFLMTGILLFSSACGIDFNPISAEEVNAAKEALEGMVVYWSPNGKVYHTHVNDEQSGHATDDGQDCPYLNRADALVSGTIEEAIAAGKTKLCSYCQRHDHIEGEGIKTDDVSEP